MEPFIGQHRIYSLAQIDDRLLIGTSKGLFIRSENIVEPLVLLTDEDNTDVNPSVFSIKTRADQILLATSHGLIALQKDNLEVQALFKTKVETRVKNKQGIAEILLPVSRIWAMDFYSEKTFIAGNDGAFEINLDTPAIVSTTVKEAENVSQPIGYIYTLVSVSDNRLFLGTEAGLVETDFAFSYFRKINQINSRKLVSVMSSGRDSYGHVWIGVAYNGLFRYDAKADSWAHLTQAQGLVTNGISQLGMSFSEDGKMAISNGTGASIVDLSQVSLDSAPGFQVRVVNESENYVFKDNEDYKIGPQIRDLTLNFLATKLIETGLHTIEYSLTTDTGEHTVATNPVNEALSFINLSPGRYAFSAVAKNTSGTVTAPVNFRFEVLPHWWETTLLKALVAVVLISLIVAYFFYRTRLLEQRMDIISDERKRIAQELHDTSLQDIFGATMLARALIADLDGNSNKDKASRFLSLIDTAILSLRSNVNSLSNLTNVPAMSQAIRQLETTLHVPDNTHMTVNETGNPWAIKHQRRFFIYRIVREAANNAAKHAQASKLNITMLWTIWSVTISIEDNGVGFAPSSPNTADTYGLKSMECMATAGKMELSVQSQPGAGTCVSITVPRFIV